MNGAEWWSVWWLTLDTRPRGRTLRLRGRDLIDIINRWRVRLADDQTAVGEILEVRFTREHIERSAG